MSFPFFPLTSLKTFTVPAAKRAISGAMAVASTVPLSLFVSGGIANAYTFPAPTNTYYQRFISATNGKLTAYDFQLVACNYYTNSPGAYVGGNSLCNILTAQPGYWDTTQILYYRLYDCTASISESKIFVNFYGLQNQPRASFQLATDSTGKILDPTNPGVPIAADVNACGSPVANFTYPSWFTPGATSQKAIWFFPYNNVTRWTKPTDSRSQAVAFFTYRTGDLSQPLTVNLSVSGTAQNGVDFDWSDPFNPAPGSPFGQLYFAPGRAVTNSILYARTVSQTTPEQTITLQMPIPTGYVSGGLDTFTGVFGPVTVPVVSVGNAGSSLTLTPGSTTEGFVITRSGNTDQPLTVTYSLSGTAQNGTDYSYLDGNLLFAANQTSVTIPITITPPSGSSSVPSKTVTVTLQAGSTPGDNQYNTTGTTTLNYTIPAYTPSQVTISQPTSTTLQPGQSSSFTVTRTGDTTNPMTVPYTLGGTAQNGTDYQALPGNVTIPAGQTTATVPINTTPQTGSTAVPQKTITVTPQAGAGYTTTGTPANYTIAAYTPQSVTVAPTAAGGSTINRPGTGSFTVTRPGTDTSQPLTIAYTTSGTAQSGTDYQALPGTVTIPAGQTTAQVPINVPAPSATTMPQRDLTVTLQPGTGYTPGSTGASTTFTIAPYQASAVDPAAGSGGTLTPGATTNGITLTRSGGDTSQPLTVGLTTGGTAQPGVDYGQLPSTVTIPAGQTTITVPIQAFPQSGTTAQPSKTVTVAVAPGSGYTTTGTPATYTIPAYTPPAPTQTPGVTLSTTGATSLNPGDSGSFTVTRTGDTSQPLTVSLNGLVTPQPSGSFPVQMPSTVTIPAGQAASTVNFTTAAGYNGTFIAALAPGAAYTSGTNTALSYRVGNGGVQYQTQTQYTSPAIITTTFDSSVPQFAVTRQVANPSDLNTVLTVPMNWQGTGVPGVDYAQLPNSVQFPAGGDRVTIPVTLLPGATGGRTITASVVPDTSSQYPSYLSGDGATGATFSIPGQVTSAPAPAPAPTPAHSSGSGGSSAALPIVGGAAAVGGLAALASGGATAAGVAGTGAVFGMLPQSCNAPSEFRAAELAKVIPAIQQQNPTWGNLRFASLPAPSSAGSMQVGGVRRAWNAGQPVDQIVRLGDVDGTFNVHCMNLEQIAKSSGMGMNLANLTLKGTGLVKETTLVKLSTTVYSRASKVSDIPGMAQFLAAKLGNSTVSADALNKLSLAEALKQYPKLADLDLGNLTLQQVPGVYSQAILADFPNWQEMRIAQVPGLRQVPFSQFPTLPRTDIRAAK